MKTIVLVLFMSTVLQAQGPVSHSLLVGGAMADLATTRIALHKGAVETSLAGSGLRAQAGVKIGLVATVEALSWAVKRGGHPTMARNHMIIWGLGQFGVAAWNWRVARRQG